MSPEEHRLNAGIAALEAQRGQLGDEVVDAALRGLQARLAALRESADEPAQALRQVTILFLDVVGSTTLGQHLDPEAIAAVMDGMLARGSAIVAAHGGKRHDPGCLRPACWSFASRAANAGASRFRKSLCSTSTVNRFRSTSCRGDARDRNQDRQRSGSGDLLAKRNHRQGAEVSRRRSMSMPHLLILRLGGS